MLPAHSKRPEQRYEHALCLEQRLGCYQAKFAARTFDHSREVVGAEGMKARASVEHRLEVLGRELVAEAVRLGVDSGTPSAAFRSGRRSETFADAEHTAPRCPRHRQLRRSTPLRAPFLTICMCSHSAGRARASSDPLGNGRRTGSDARKRNASVSMRSNGACALARRRSPERGIALPRPPPGRVS